MNELLKDYQLYVPKSDYDLYYRLKKGDDIVVTPINDDTKKYDLYAHPPHKNTLDTIYGPGSTTTYKFTVKVIGTGINGHFMYRIPVGPATMLESKSLQPAPLNDIKAEYNFWEKKPYKYNGGKPRTRRNLQKKSRKHRKSYKNRKSRKC